MEKNTTKIIYCYVKKMYIILYNTKKTEEVTVFLKNVFFPMSISMLLYPLQNQSFIYSPSDALVSCLKRSIKIYNKTAPTCFGVTVTPSSGSALIGAY